MKSFHQILTEAKVSKKAIKQAEIDAKEWSNNSENQNGVAWIILTSKNKLVVTANSNDFKGKILSKWVNGYKEVHGIKLLHYEP